MLVRFWPEDLARVNKVCADAAVPRENWIRRLVVEELLRLAVEREQRAHREKKLAASH